MNKKLVFFAVMVFSFMLFSVSSSERNAAGRKESFFKFFGFDGSGKFNFKEAGNDTYGFGIGFKALFKGVDFRGSCSTANLTYDQKCEFRKIQIGMAWDFNKIFRLPLMVKGGNISYSGLVSKLKNPFLSISFSPVSNGISFSEGLGVYFPGAGSSEKELSCNSSINVKLSQNSDLLLGAVLFDGENFFAYGGIDFFIKKNQRLNFSFVAADFFVSNQNSSWFSDTKLFPEQRLVSGAFQLDYEGKNAKSSFLMNVYEKPEGEAAFTFLSKNWFQKGMFSVNCSGYLASENEIFTPSKKRLTTRFQFQLIPVVKIFERNGKFLLTLGNGFLLEQKKPSVFEPEELWFRDSFGFTLRTKPLLWKSVYSVNQLNFYSSSAFEKSVLKFYNTISINNKTALFFGMNVSVTPETKSQIFSTETRLSFSGNVAGLKGGRISSAIAFVTKNSEISKITPEFAFIYRRKFKFFEVSGSLGISWGMKGGND